MMSAAPLGSLAEVILEQYGELIEAAIEDAARRRLAVAPVDQVMPPNRVTFRFGIDELAEMHIQPGNWVAVGRIGDIQQRTLIEINLSSWEWRESTERVEVQETLVHRVDESASIPPTASQAAS